MGLVLLIVITIVYLVITGVTVSKAIKSDTSNLRHNPPDYSKRKSYFKEESGYTYKFIAEDIIVEYKTPLGNVVCEYKAPPFKAKYILDVKDNTKLAVMHMDEKHHEYSTSRFIEAGDTFPYSTISDQPSCTHLENCDEETRDTVYELFNESEYRFIVARNPLDIESLKDKLYVEVPSNAKQEQVHASIISYTVRKLYVPKEVRAVTYIAVEEENDATNEI